MNVSRKEFLQALGLTAAASALSGCKSPFADCGAEPVAPTLAMPKIALQLYSLHRYLGGMKDKDGKVTLAARGLEKGLEDVAKIGYTGIEFAGYYGFEAAQLKKMLADNGLVACGTHVVNCEFGFKIDKEKGTFAYDPEILKKTCDFNLGYGNDYICCPGGGNVPPNSGWGVEQPAATKEKDEWIKKLCDLYNKAAADAAKMGCKIGLHNHMWEHNIKLTDGTSYWDYFFQNTDKNVCMEQDVGWSTCAGIDPCKEFLKYPGRSPTLHAKENGMGKDVEKFDAILGKPGCDANGKPCAVPVDWDALIPVAKADGVKWFVVECEQHFEDLSAVTPSYAFLKSKGLI